MDKETLTQVVTIICVIIGVSLSGLVSYGLSQSQYNTETTNLAKGIYSNIAINDKTLEYWASFYLNNSHYENNSLVLLNVTELSIPDGSLISQSEIYPSVSRDIARFNQPLSQNLYQYYSELYDAENQRSIIKEGMSTRATLTMMNMMNSSDNFVNMNLINQHYQRMQVEIIHCYYNLSPKIRSEIIKEYGV